MNLSEKYKDMSDSDKLKYLFNKMINSAGIKEREIEILNEVQKILKGTALDEIFTKFDLSGEIIQETEKSPKQLIVHLADDINISFELNDTNRKDFKDANPEQVKPIKTMLTDAERKELSADTGMVIPDSK